MNFLLLLSSPVLQRVRQISRANVEGGNIFAQPGSSIDRLLVVLVIQRLFICRNTLRRYTFQLSSKGECVKHFSTKPGEHSEEEEEEEQEERRRRERCTNSPKGPHQVLAHTLQTFHDAIYCRASPGDSSYFRIM